MAPGHEFTELPRMKTLNPRCPAFRRMALTAAIGLLFTGLRRETAAAAVAPVSAGMALWEDTADAERFLQQGHGRALDDHLTVSLAAWSTLEHKGRPWRLLLAQHVITDKQAGRRVDLSTLRFGSRLHPGRAILDLETGLAALGRTGGQNLQNGYHRLFDVASVDLDYPRTTRVGPLLAGRIAWPLVSRHPEAAVLELHTVDTAAGFHRARALLRTRWRPLRALHAEAYAGAARYHHLDPSLARAFQGGREFGLLLDWQALHHWHLDAWLLADIYRPNQANPGLSIEWHTAADPGSVLSRVLMP